MGNSRKLEGCQLYFRYFKKIKGMSRGTGGWFGLTSVQGKIVEQLFQNLSRENLEVEGIDNSSNSWRQSLSEKNSLDFFALSGLQTHVTKAAVDLPLGGQSRWSFLPFRFVNHIRNAQRLKLPWQSFKQKIIKPLYFPGIKRGLVLGLGC